MTVVHPHTMMATAGERIADLHRDAAPRPEVTAKGKRRRHHNRSAKRLETARAVGAQQR